MSRPTQKDVAEIAGVSRATVSYVINKRSGGNVHITDETRNRVLAAIEQIGYQPNMLARSLRTQKTGLVAVMVDDLTNPFYPLLIRGAQQIANENDYQLLIYDCNSDPRREKDFVDIMLGRQVDGIIMVPFHLQAEDVARLIAANINVVIRGSIPQVPGVDHVIIDDQKAVTELIDFLYQKGHRRIAHLAGRQDSPPGQNRLAGYRQALSNHGLPYDESLVRYGQFQRAGVEELTLSLFSDRGDPNRPTALFAANDIMAIEALRTLDSHGWAVPGEVAVCGFDNIPRSEVVVPALTTIDQSSQYGGQLAAELLIERMGAADGHSESRVVKTPYNLIIRDSA